MLINRLIPGQLREEEMQAIALLAKLAPENMPIVEVGSLLGLSSWIWSRNCDPSCQVICIDPWELAGGGGNFNKLANENEQLFTLQQFIENVKDCQNIVPIRAFSPEGLKSFNSEIGLYFEDAVHQDPILGQNLEFWAAKLGKSGILCGHDYHEKFPDVRRHAEEYADRLGRKLRLIGALWFLLPRYEEDELTIEQRDALAKLEVLEAYLTGFPKRDKGEALRDFFIRTASEGGQFQSKIELIAPIEADFLHNDHICVAGRLTNPTATDWPIICEGKPALELGFELWSGFRPKKVEAVRYHFPMPTLKAGASAPFQAMISTKRADRGKAEIRLGPLYRNAFWFSEFGDEPISVKVSVN